MTRVARQLQSAQRQFDLRERCLRAVEADRLHRLAQFNAWMKRNGLRGGLWLPDELMLRAIGAS